MPRDNLLNSACLELFEFIKRENIKMIIQHLVDTYREKLQAITYVDTFQNLILRYDQMHEPVTTQELDHSFTSIDSDTPVRNVTAVNGGKWGQALKDVDADEEAYFNASDDEEEPVGGTGKPVLNGASPVRPLVNYPDDDADDDDMDILAAEVLPDSAHKKSPSTQHTQDDNTSPRSASAGSPPERISEKRRREEDEEDELLASISTSAGPKRRASTTSTTSTSSLRNLRRKSPNVNSGKDGGGGGPKKILPIPLKSGGGDGGAGE